MDSATLGPIFNPITTRHYGAAFAQDSWKISSKLTLTYGLRWSGNSPQYEESDKIANFDPLLPDPNYGGGPGAVEYMGNGTGTCRQTRAIPGNWIISDRPSAWPIASTSGRRARRLRHKFHPGSLRLDLPRTAPFNQTDTVATDSKGNYLPVFNVDNGYPKVSVPANMDPSYAAKYGGTRYSPGYVGSGYVQNFNFGFQREMQKDLVLELEWRGEGNPRHSAGTITPNQIDPRNCRAAPRSPRPSALPRRRPPPAALSVRRLQRTGAYTLLPFPQLTNKGLGAFGDPVGMSTYHSLNLIATKRMSHGIYAYGAYTFSKNIANVTDVSNGGGGGGIQIPTRATRTRPSSPATAPTSSRPPSIGIRRGKGAPSWAMPTACSTRWWAAGMLRDPELPERYAPRTPILAHPPQLLERPGVYANFNTPAGGFKEHLRSRQVRPLERRQSQQPFL